MCSGAASGKCTFDDVPKRIQISRVYEPNSENRKLYEELFNEFINIYNSNRSIHRRLNSRR
jgi:xylulokinase